MTETADWTPTFDRVSQIPGENSLKPPKNLAEQQAWINKRNAANIAVSMGGVDTGRRLRPVGLDLQLVDRAHRGDRHSRRNRRPELIARLPC